MTTGFLDESPNVRSMSRLVMLMLTASCVLLVLTLCVVSLWGAYKGHDYAAGVAALAAPLGTVLAGNYGVARERNKGVSDAPEGNA